jgi:hypothetical protein
VRRASCLALGCICTPLSTAPVCGVVAQPINRRCLRYLPSRALSSSSSPAQRSFERPGCTFSINLTHHSRAQNDVLSSWKPRAASLPVQSEHILGTCEACGRLIRPQVRQRHRNIHNEHAGRGEYHCCSTVRIPTASCYETLEQLLTMRSVGLCSRAPLASNMRRDLSARIRWGR